MTNFKKVLASAGAAALFLSAAVPALASAHRVDSFVCPVFNSDAVGANNPNAEPIGGGDFTILGPEVAVPIGATNDEGAGTPPGAHATPGDVGYTAIWNLE